MNYNRIIATLFFCLILLSGCASTANNEKKTEEKNTVTYEKAEVGFEKGGIPDKVPADMALAAKSDTLELYVIPDGNYIGQFCVRNTSSKAVFYSNPQNLENDTSAKGSPKFEMYSQLILFGYDTDTNTERTVNSYIGTEKGKKVALTRLTNGFSAKYVFDDEKLTVTLYVTLTKDHITVRCPAGEIAEKGNFKLISMALTPYMGSGGRNDEGYLLVPDGSGALINFNNGKTSAEPYSVQLYGEDPALAGEMKYSYPLTASLPVFGINRNKTGLVGIVTDGDASAKIEALVSKMKNSQNIVYTDFLLRSRDTVVVGESGYSQTKEIIKYDMEHFSNDAYSVAYYPLEQGNYTYSDMAVKYREILKSGREKQNNIETTPNLYAEMVGGFYKKETYFGLTLNTYHVLTAFEDIKTVKDELAGSGVKNLSFLFSDWSVEQARFQIQNKVSVKGQLGKIKEFGEGSLSLSYSPFGMQKSGNGFFKFFDAAKRLSKEPVQAFQYQLSTHYKDKNKNPGYYPNVKTLSLLSEKFLTSLSKTKVTGVYLPDFGSVLYTDFNQSAYASRGDIKQAVTGVLDSFSKKVTVKAPNAYMLPYTDVAVSLPQSASNFDIEDMAVPFYQIAVSGLMEFTSEPVNLSDNPEKNFLKTLETGANLYFVWIKKDASVLKETYLNSLYGANYSRWKDFAAEKQKKAETVFEKIGSRVIKSHEILSKYETKTTFENGKSILINYRDLSYQIS